MARVRQEGISIKHSGCQAYSKNPFQFQTQYFRRPGIPVEMEDPFTRMCQNFFSFLSHTQQRGYVIATTQALSFSFFPPFSTTVVCVCSTVLLEFPNHPQEFPNLPTPMVSMLHLIVDMWRKENIRLLSHLIFEVLFKPQLFRKD